MKDRDPETSPLGDGPHGKRQEDTTDGRTQGEREVPSRLLVEGRTSGGPKGSVLCKDGEGVWCH